MPDDGSSIEADRRNRAGAKSWLARIFAKKDAASSTVEVSRLEDVNAPTPTPSEMRLRVSEFETARVSDVMIPRVEIKAVEMQTTLSDLMKIFSEEAHSRLPVYRDALDDPIGLIHIKDVVAEISSGRVEDPATDQPIQRIKREILFVPASMRLPDLLVKMQTSRIHLALVVDEYGGTDGLVSLEDLVEQIVGDIEDEHDEDDAYFVRRAPGVWEADARAEIEDFEEESQESLSLANFEGEIDTLGGLVFALAGRVPQRGEIVEHPDGVTFEIMEADPRRIKKLRVRCAKARVPASAASSPTQTEVVSKAAAGDA